MKRTKANIGAGTVLTLFGIKITVGLLLTMITIVLTTVSLVIAICALRQGILNTRYPQMKGVSGIEIDTTFSPSTPQYYDITMCPGRGTLMYSHCQVSGVSGARYQLNYKKSTASKWSSCAAQSIQTNNQWSNPVTITSCKAGVKYDFKVKKTNCPNATCHYQLDLTI